MFLALFACPQAGAAIPFFLFFGDLTEIKPVMETGAKVNNPFFVAEE
jgi:hypothetical protein